MFYPKKWCNDVIGKARCTDKMHFGKINVRVNQSQCLVITYSIQTDGLLLQIRIIIIISKKTWIFRNLSKKKESFGAGIMKIKNRKFFVMLCLVSVPIHRKYSIYPFLTYVVMLQYTVPSITYWRDHLFTTHYLSHQIQKTVYSMFTYNIMY